MNAIGTIYHTISKHLNTASPDGTVQEESKEALEKAVSYYKLVLLNHSLASVVHWEGMH